jgi:flagellar hook-associated protein 3 FlgL
MSVTGISNASNMLTGILGQLASNSVTQQARLSQLTEQSSTGLVAQTFGGLGSTAHLSLNLNPQLSAIDAYTQNITALTPGLTVTSQVLTQLQQIATTFYSGTVNMTGQTSQEVDAMAEQANSALSQVQGLLNSKVGDSYIFAGQDSSNEPVPDTQFNAYVQGIQNAVTGNLSTTGSATIAATLSAATTGSPFSTTLGTTQQSVGVGFGVTAKVGIVAGTNAYATSSEAGSTGSYVRDLIRSLATISALSSTDATSASPTGASFTALVADTRTNLGNEITDIGNENAGLGAAQQVLTSDQTALTDTKQAVTSQLSSVQNVDAAATATALTQAQTQMEMSYKLIASMQQMSLVQYLPASG